MNVVCKTQFGKKRLLWLSAKKYSIKKAASTSKGTVRSTVAYDAVHNCQARTYIDRKKQCKSGGKNKHKGRSYVLYVYSKIHFIFYFYIFNSFSFLFTSPTLIIDINTNITSANSTNVIKIY